MPVSSALSHRADTAERSAGPDPVPARSRLWLEFVNTDAAAQSPRGDLLRDFDALVSWLNSHAALDDERSDGIRRRAILQPAAAAATLVEARRVRASLRVLAERGASLER